MVLSKKGMKTKQENVLFQSLVSEIEEECEGNNSQIQNERRKILEAVQDYMKKKDNQNDPPKQNRKEGTETIIQPSEKKEREEKRVESICQREHLRRKFEIADLDQFLQKYPDESLNEKFINDVKGMGVCAMGDIQQADFLAFYRGKEISEDKF